MGDDHLMEESRAICDELVNQPKALLLDACVGKLK